MSELERLRAERDEAIALLRAVRTPGALNQTLPIAAFLTRIDTSSDATCPTCDGTGEVMVDSMTLVGVHGGEIPDRCPTCNGSGEVESMHLRVSCPNCSVPEPLCDRKGLD